MPIEPPVSDFILPVAKAGDGDVIARGGDLEPGTLLQGYRTGLFPMFLETGELAWWSPVERAIVPLDGLRISRSLRQSCRRYGATLDEAFEDVVAGCADPSRPGHWITDEIASAYLEMNRLGWAHSIEVWDSSGSLVGGLYGVGVGGLFAGESMFHLARDASKVALVQLVVLLTHGGGQLLDVQWMTPHLESMGAVVVGRDRYMDLLSEALSGPDPFESTPTQFKL